MAIALSDEAREKMYMYISRSLSDQGHPAPIFQAACASEPVVVTACLRIGVDKDSKDGWGETPLMKAAKNGCVSVARVLIRAGADVDIGAYGYNHPSDYRGYTSLHWASENGHDDLVVVLLRAGACIDAKCDSGETPLLVAVMHNKLAVVNDLLSLRADVSISNNKQETALLHASFQAYSEIVQTLLRRGADVNATGMENGGNPLHALCKGIRAKMGDVVDVEFQTAAFNTLDALLRWGVNERAADVDGHLPAEFVEEPWGAMMSVEEENVSFPIRRALARASADKAWYRRGWILMFRKRVLCDKSRSTQLHGGGLSENTRLAKVIHWLVEKEGDELLRCIVGFI